MTSPTAEAIRVVRELARTHEHAISNHADRITEAAALRLVADLAETAAAKDRLLAELVDGLDGLLGIEAARDAAGNLGAARAALARAKAGG
jgi:hypothetical protein